MRPPSPARPGRVPWLLGIVLTAVAWLAGTPGLRSPWILGDEHIFIVRNPDVTGEGDPRPNLLRIVRIFDHFHEDLYQPIPIALYAIQWASFGDNPAAFRATDVLLHAANALLVWRVLLTLLTTIGGFPRSHGLTLLTWALTLVWAVHPALSHAYFGDVGTPHLLNAIFTLSATLIYVRCLIAPQSAPGAVRRFVVVAVLLLCAMLSKPTPGWLLLAGALELATVGPGAMARSFRIYVIAAICAGAAVLTLYTSREAGLIEEATKGLFGDPLSRSMLAMWVYVRSLLLPFWLSVWYLPDPRTGWHYPLVWVGVLVTVATLAHAVWCWRQPSLRVVTVGWAWFWGYLLPVIGLVGAREAIAFDRYLYQPFAALLLIAGFFVARRRSVAWAGSPRMWPRAALGVVAIVAAGMLALDLGLIPGQRSPIESHRSALQRAYRVLALNPGDPRALEMLAVTCDFVSTRNLPECDERELDKAPPGSDPRRFQFEHFRGRYLEALRAAAQAMNLDLYFPGPADKAQFHRRLSYRFLTCGAAADALSQADRAYALEPNEQASLMALARALRLAGRFVEAAAAYARREPLLPDEAEVRMLHHAEFAELLELQLDRPDQALQHYRAAVETRLAPPRTWLGLARCEIRAGIGANGFQIVEEMLHQNPRDVEAALVLAEYHLRSHHWDEAKRIYQAVLESFPTRYEALLGFHELCIQTGEYLAAAAAWDTALNQAPGERLLRAFRAWAAMCAGESAALGWADELLRDQPADPLACMVKLLAAVRASRWDEAIDWAQRGTGGPHIPLARPLARARATLSVMRSRGELPASSAVIEAELWRLGGEIDRAREALETAGAIDNPELERAMGRVRSALSQATSGPAER
jgi:tetratricopeptide (TPR) repeat protein